MFYEERNALRRGLVGEASRARFLRWATQVANAQPSDMIPIYSSNGHLLRWEAESKVRDNAHHFNLVQNRRGHLKEAHLKADLSFDDRPASRIGQTFTQTLATGRVYALNGVRGSGGRDLVGACNGQHNGRDLASA